MSAQVRHYENNIFLDLESTLDVIEAYNSVQNVVETFELIKREVGDYHTR